MSSTGSFQRSTSWNRLAGHFQDPAVYANWIAQDPESRRWWSYGACSSAGTCSNGTVGPPQYTYPNYDVDGTPVANRAMEWLTYLHRQKGELYSASIAVLIPRSTIRPMFAVSTPADPPPPR